MSGAVDEIIAGRTWGSQEQPAHHRFIVTLFGFYGRPSGRSIPVAVLVRLLTELGCEAASVRSSVSRLKKAGVLVSARAGGQSGYALAEELEPHMLAGDERIFSPRSASIGDPWLLVSFSVPESERSKRHRIRAGLARMGFGTVAPGLCIAPARLRAEAIGYMHGNGLSDYVEFFVSEPAGAGDLRAKVARWWDLEALEGEYRAFVDTFGAEAERWSTHAEGSEDRHRAAFQTYVPLVTQWRRLPYLDPGLPLELLPPGWMGVTARRVFGELNRVLRPMALDYVERMVAAGSR